MRLLIELDRIQVSITGPGSGYKTVVHNCLSKAQEPIKSARFPEKLLSPWKLKYRLKLKFDTTKILWILFASFILYIEIYLRLYVLTTII